MGIEGGVLLMTPAAPTSYFGDSLLFFFLLILLLLKDTPYCLENPSVFLLFFLNLIMMFGVYYI